MPGRIKNFLIIISVITVVLYRTDALAADKKVPILNKIFHIDTAGKCKKTEKVSNVKTGKKGARPGPNEPSDIDEGNGDGEKERLYVELGDAYTKSKLYKSAIEAYENALRINPDNSEVHFNLGLLYERYLGDTQKAIHHMKICLKTAPSPKKAEEAKYYLAIMREGRDWEIIKY